MTGFLTAMLFAIQQLVAVLRANVLKFDAALGVTFVLPTTFVLGALLLTSNVAIGQVFAGNRFLLSATTASNLINKRFLN